MKTIGITGGIGAGKSFIIDFIKENCSCVVVKADELAKSLEYRDGICYGPLVELLGEDILDEDRQIIPRKMAELVFKDEKLLEGVNNIVHPAVKNKLLDMMAYEEKKGENDFFFIEAALLIEDGYSLILDEIWYIYTDENIRRERLKSSRGYSDEKIDSIFSKQLDDATFRHYSNVVIDNNGDTEITKNQIITALKREN